MEIITVTLHKFPNPLEHATMLINAHHGDLLEAWRGALVVWLYVSPREDKSYWADVADSIARHRPNYVDPQYFRSSRFKTN